MTIQEVQNLAEKNGFNIKAYQRVGDSDWIDFKDVCLDKEFWQALGKAMGWEEKSGIFKEPGHFELAQWWVEWHRFIDHLAEGKTIEDYFNQLERNE